MAEKNTSTLLILTSYRCSGRMAQLSEGALVRWRKLGCNWVPTPACLLPFFFSFIVFLPFGFLLFILTAEPLASRDFCENVFLVVNIIVNSYCPAQNSIFANCVNKETVTCCMKFIQFISSFIIFACVVLNLNIVRLLPRIYLFMVLSNSILSLFLYPFSYPFSCRALRER